MKYHSDGDFLSLTVTEIAGYAYPCENPKMLEKIYGFFAYADNEPLLQSGGEPLFRNSPVSTGISHHNQSETDAQELGASVEAELTYRTEIDGCKLEIHGRADSISYDGEYHTITEYKTIGGFPHDFSPLQYSEHFAQAVCYAYMICNSKEIDTVAITLVYIRRSDGIRRSFRAIFHMDFLSRAFIALLSRILPFARRVRDRESSLRKECSTLPFPFSSIRDTQSDFVQEAYKTIRRGERLFVSAPTGTGKTVSSLYPALRAYGSGNCDRIFYTTAKTITGKAAIDTFQMFTEHAPHLRGIMLLAKESLCTANQPESASVSLLQCPVCPERADTGTGSSFQPYRRREHLALQELLEKNIHFYMPEQIRHTAMRHNVCPYELALDLSEFCEIIVCDYNHIFDDRIRLRRYFKNENRQEKYVFCVDEAHNLPDRARDMYSSSLTIDQIGALHEVQKKNFPLDTPFADAICRAEILFQHFLTLCEDESVLTRRNDQDITIGYYRNSCIPEEIGEVFGALLVQIRQYIRTRHECASELLSYHRLFVDFLSILEYADERFCFFLERENEQITAHILCLDPAGMLNRMLDAAHAAILFSATLSPIEYYKNVTGSPNSAYLELASPYAKKNLCLIAYDGISTRFTDRKTTVEETAEIIAQTVSIQKGKYIAYFPSYAYMRLVCRTFCRIAPDTPVVMQKSGMSFQERERFLQVFFSTKRRHVVGFCVLGGMFSEGIDLSGNALIGAIIIGTGMPGLSAEKNLIAEYYQNTMEKGREYAYIYPGMNKVLQAAGRVIRSEEDRGIVLLIDDRYHFPEMQLLFPAHWKHIRYTRDPHTLEHLLTGFWSDHNIKNP